MAITLSRDGDVAVLTIDNPGHRNALDDEHTLQMLDHLDALEQDPSAGAIVLTGTGRHFTPGGRLDMLEELAGQARDPERSRALEQRMRTNARVVEALSGSRLPSVAAINGTCVGAGLGWAAACDLRIAAAGATFDSAFLKLGLGTDFGTAWLLGSVLGRAAAADWLLRPRRRNADEALAQGFVSEVVEDSALPTTARDTAAALAGTPSAVAAIRAGLREATTRPLGDHLDDEAARFVASLATREAGGRIEAANAALRARATPQEGLLR
ncbi:MAG: enoyl-CoA hydratase/isomerase family protein [Micrococcus sp.]|nr:enoyl-CoA hydratase/isomerase family protein [Micrococcus sp.]